jgi:glycerate kinase
LIFKVLIAPDKFKGTLSAHEVADALGAGFPSETNVKMLPLADGGDGSIEAIVAAGFEVIELDPSIPSTTTEPARIARKGDVFFIEAAEFCGLRQVNGALDPLTANSLGVGYAMRAALDLGAHTIVLGVGGTASTDGGVGFLMGLGAKFFSETGESIPLGGGGLFILSKVDLSGIDPRIANAQIILASDVDSPLLGQLGAAKTFAAQKGADPLQMEVLELGLKHLTKVLSKRSKLWGNRTREAVDTPGAGAGGGLGFAALLIGARRVAGADYILNLLDVDDALAHCDLVITGEGCLDQQSLAGKLPVVLALRARALGIPVVAVVGTCRLNKEEYVGAGFTTVFALDEFDVRCANDSALSERLLTQVGGIISHNI